MKYSSNSVNMQPEILKRKLGGELFSNITLDSTAFTNHICKAGTPIDADGNAVNGGESDGTAIGILYTDATDENPNATIIRAFASINLANAESNSGLTIASAVKTALNLLVFE